MKRSLRNLSAVVATSLALTVVTPVADAKLYGTWDSSTRLCMVNADSDTQRVVQNYLRELNQAATDLRINALSKHPELFPLAKEYELLLVEESRTAEQEARFQELKKQYGAALAGYNITTDEFNFFMTAGTDLVRKTAQEIDNQMVPDSLRQATTLQEMNDFKTLVKYDNMKFDMNFKRTFHRYLGFPRFLSYSDVSHADARMELAADSVIREFGQNVYAPLIDDCIRQAQNSDQNNSGSGSSSDAGFIALIVGLVALAGGLFGWLMAFAPQFRA